MSLDQHFISKMQDIYAEFSAYDAAQNDRIDRYRNIEPDSASFLAMQVRIQRSKLVLEIGTSTGYSTLWLAEAVKSTQGKVDTIEVDLSRIEIAKKNAEALGLQEYIQFHHMDALTFLELSQKPYDFIVLDAERSEYLKYWHALSNMLDRKGTVLVVDNVISHAQDVIAFIELIDQDQRFMHQTVTLGAGLLFVTAI